MTKTKTKFLSYNSGGQKSDMGLYRLNQAVSRAAFLLEALLDNLLSCTFQELEAAQILCLMVPLTNDNVWLNSPTAIHLILSFVIFLTDWLISCPSLPLLSIFMNTVGLPLKSRIISLFYGLLIRKFNYPLLYKMTY